MAKSEVYSAADACLSPRRPMRAYADGTCPDCGGSYYNSGLGGGVLDELSGEILCETCALRNILEDYRVYELAEALGLKYIQPEDIDGYE